MQKIKPYLKRLLKRRQKKISTTRAIRSGIKGAITIMALAAISHFSEMPLIIAPFAATCITVFATPKIKFAQPMNVIGGYMVATLIGIIATKFFPHLWWMLGISTFFTIFLMSFFRVTHPPAGAIPLLIYFYHTNVDYGFAIFPILSGSVAIVIIAILLHSAPPKRQYPSD